MSVVLYQKSVTTDFGCNIPAPITKFWCELAKGYRILLSMKKLDGGYASLDIGNRQPVLI